MTYEHIDVAVVMVLHLFRLANAVAGDIKNADAATVRLELLDVISDLLLRFGSILSEFHTRVNSDNLFYIIFLFVLFAVFFLHISYLSLILLCFSWRRFYYRNWGLSVQLYGRGSLLHCRI